VSQLVCCPSKGRMARGVRDRHGRDAVQRSLLGGPVSDSEEHGFQVNVVNAQRTKTLPGRKTDVLGVSGFRSRPCSVC